MTNIEFMEKALPIAPLKIIALKSCEPLAKKVDGSSTVTLLKNLIQNR